MLGEVMSCCRAGNVFSNVMLWLQTCLDSKGICKRDNMAVMLQSNPPKFKLIFLSCKANTPRGPTYIHA